MKLRIQHIKSAGITTGATLLLYLSSALIGSPAMATACPSFPGIGNSSTFTSCTSTISTTTGRDYASTETAATNNAVLNLGASASLTINSTGVLVIGSISFVNNTASIAIQSGGKVLPGGKLWVSDANGDGFADNLTTLYTATASGRRRLGLMHSVACSPATTWYRDSDGDGFGNAAVTTLDCVQPAGYVANSTDCNDTGTNSSHVHASGTCYTDADQDGYGTGSAKTCMDNATCSSATWASGGAGSAAVSGHFSSNNTDCNDTGTNSSHVHISATCYTDADQDGYGTGSAYSCTDNATCSSVTWASGGAGATAVSGHFASNNTDCYDSNANAYPGSTYCGTVNRGDGSYDYNCDAANTFCGTTYGYSGTYTYNITGPGYSCNAGRFCIGAAAGSGYPYPGPSCGVAAYACTGTTATHTTCWDGQKSDLTPCTYADSTVCTSISAIGTQGCN